VSRRQDIIQEEQQQQQQYRQEDKEQNGYGYDARVTRTTRVVRRESCIGGRKDSSVLPVKEEHREASSSRDRGLKRYKSQVKDRLTRPIASTVLTRRREKECVN